MTTPTSSKAAKLAAAAQEAAEVRAFQTHPDVIALRIERLRRCVDALIWTGMVLGLLFTMANVQGFAAGDARPPWIDDPNASLAWVTAWLLDPTVSLVLIGVLIGEQVISRHGIKAGAWVRITKWTALGCTYAMNTWASWHAVDPAAILLHSVPPAIVFCAAEAVTTLRVRITEAVMVAHTEAVHRAAGLRAVAAETLDGPYGPALDPDETRTDETRTRRRSTRTGFRTAMRRTRTALARMTRTDEAAAKQARVAVPPIRWSVSFPPPWALATQTRPDELPESHEAPEPDEARADESEPDDAPESDETRTDDAPEPPAVEVDRDAIVREFADEAYASLRIGERWKPDYAALMARTGRKRSWSEKVAADARRAARERLAAEDAEAVRAYEANAARTDETEAPELVAGVTS